MNLSQLAQVYPPGPGEPMLLYLERAVWDASLNMAVCERCRKRLAPTFEIRQYLSGSYHCLCSPSGKESRGIEYWKVDYVNAVTSKPVLEPETSAWLLDVSSPGSTLSTEQQWTRGTGWDIPF